MHTSIHLGSKSLYWTIATFAIVVLLLAACQPAAPLATSTPVPPTQPAPTATSLTPSVSVSDQDIIDGKVTVEEVVSDGPGWIVIHADADGAPGPVVGHAPVQNGVNQNVQVSIDTAAATETLYAMLHTDAGVQGEYEFPGDDVPVKVNGQVVTPPFKVTGGLPVTPSVTVSDQDIVNDTVTVQEVVSNGPGWIVIHADENGAPGPVIGHAPVSNGSNKDVTVKIDTANATQTLYAMLHTDAGVQGEYEFPGEDIPVKVNGEVVTPPFEINGGLPATPTATASAQDNGEGTGTVIMLVDKTFSPSELTVPVGTTVVWKHESSLPHTVTSDTGLFDSGTLARGDTFEFTFTKAGTYPYHCKFHGDVGGVGMSGVITVTDN
jgi:plastocyanin